MGSGLTRWQEAPLPALPPAETPMENVPRELGDVVALVWDPVFTVTRSDWETGQPKTR